MATTDEDRKARPNSFGDAAAATVNPAVTQPEMFNKTKPGVMTPTPGAAGSGPFAMPRGSGVTPIPQTQEGPTSKFVPVEMPASPPAAASVAPVGFTTVNGGSRPMAPSDAQALANQNRATVAGAQAMGAQQQQTVQADTAAARTGALQRINQAVNAPGDVPMLNMTRGGPFGAKPPVPTPAQVAAPASAPAIKPAAAPLDPQAAADRAMLARGFDVARGLSEGAGRAIADVATIIPRGLAGAYDSAVVRPMRAAGLDAAYLSPKLVPDGVNPASMTPFTDQMRMNQPTQAAPTAKTAPAVATAATNPAGPTSTTMPVGEPVRNVPGNNQPNPTSSQSPSQNPDAPKQDPMTGVAVNNQVRATRQPNGVMEFSGNNVAGDVTYTGNSGFKPSGAGVNTMSAANFMQANPSTAGALGDARRTAMQAGNLDAVAASMGAPVSRQGAVASGAERVDGRLGFNQDEARTLLRDAMTKRPGESRADFATRSGAAQRALGLEVDERGNIRGNQTQQRGQDVVANTADADRNSRERMEQGRQGLDAQRLGLDAERMADERTANGFKIRAAEQQERLFTEWANAKTPEEKASAAEKLRMLQGGGEQRESWGYAPGRPITDENGTYETPGVIYNKATGETREVAKGGGQARAPEAAQQRPVGTTSNVNGKVAVWDGKQWIPQ